MTTVMRSFAAALLLGTLPGCMAAIAAGNLSRQASQANGVIDLPEPRANILAIAAEVGKELGYRVSGMNQQAGYVSLEVHNVAAGSVGADMAVGIVVMSQNGGRQSAITLTMTGGYGQGSYENAEKKGQEFKTKLAERLA